MVIFETLVWYSENGCKVKVMCTVKSMRRAFRLADLSVML